MKRKFFLSVLVLAICAGVFFIARSNFRAQGTHSAHRPIAADFTLPDLNGNPLTLSNYRGKVVLLDFWATWCDPCREEIPRFVELQEKYHDQGFQIIGISIDDSPEPVREFQRQFNINYPVVMGNAKIAQLYGGILGLPVAFVIGKDGEIHAKHVGAADASVIEKEILRLLSSKGGTS